jgi:hypothetical protein
MGIEVGTALLIAGGLAATSTAVGIVQSKKAKKEQQTANARIQAQETKRLALETKRFEAQQKATRIAENRARLQQVRQRRIARAQVTQRVATSGGSATGEALAGSSGFQGTVASQGAQVGSNLSFLNTQSQIGQDIAGIQFDIFNVNQNIANIQRDSAMTQARIAGDFGSIRSIFDTGSKIARAFAGGATSSSPSGPIHVGAGGTTAFGM